MSEYPITLDVAVFDMSTQRNIEAQCNRIVLHEKYIECEVEIVADEPPITETGERDEQLPWRQYKTHFSDAIKREAIIGLSVTYIKFSKIYKVAIIVPGADPRFYFKTRSKAEDFANQLKKYIFP